MTYSHIRRIVIKLSYRSRASPTERHILLNITAGRVEEHPSYDEILSDNLRLFDYVG